MGLWNRSDTALFHTVGNLPSQIDWLNIAVTAGVML